MSALHDRQTFASYAVDAFSFLLVGALCLLALLQGLLPGLLAACLGMLFARALRKARFFRKQAPGWVPAALAILVPLALLGLVGFNAKAMAILAVSQYQDLLEHLAVTLIDLRNKLPPDVAAHLPEGLEAVQSGLANWIREQSGALAMTGRAWLHGLLLAYVGLVVGALSAGVPRDEQNPAPLTASIRRRAGHFLDSFSQIVTAQFWIAAVNATLTAVFLLGVLPLAGVTLPYTGGLITFTFVAGLIPIVGNLLCNFLVTLVGLSVSPLVGLACLLFLIAIHKLEYFINAKVVGAKTKTAAWELLAIMFAGEALFGVPGLVAAPLYYAYLKAELKAAGLV